MRESEAYADQVSAMAKRRKGEAEASSPFYRYPAAEIAADFGAMRSRLTVRIVKLSAAFGAAHLWKGLLCLRPRADRLPLMEAAQSQSM